MPLKHVYRWITDIRVDAGLPAPDKEEKRAPKHRPVSDLDVVKEADWLIAKANERVDTFEQINDRLRDKVAEEQAEVRRRDELLREIQKKYLHEPDTDGYQYNCRDCGAHRWHHGPPVEPHRESCLVAAIAEVLG